MEKGRQTDSERQKVHNKTKSIERKGKRCEGKKRLLQIKQNLYRENR